MYVILYEYILENNYFVKTFNSEDVKLENGGIIYKCHKIFHDYVDDLKFEGNKCKICPNSINVDYKAYRKPLLKIVEL